MSALTDMQERVGTARIERDRLIAEGQAQIDDANRRFAALLDAEKAQVEVDEEGLPQRLNTGGKIAKAAGLDRVYMYAYIDKHLKPKKDAK